MSTTTIKEQILSGIETRLADIRTANKYRTEIGAEVKMAVLQVDPDDLPAVIVWPRPEEVERGYNENHCTMPVELEAMSKHESNEPVDVSEVMLADLIECMTGNSWTLPFDTGSTEIEAGDTITGATSGTTGYVISVSVTNGSWAEDDAEGTITLRRVKGEFQAENIKVSGSVVAAATAGATGESAITAMGSLIDDIEYAGGGSDTYPQPGEVVTATQAVFNIKYKTLVGDPYSQPD